MKIVITFSVNEKRFHEKDLRIIARQLKKLKSPNCDEDERLGISNLISEYLEKGKIPKNIKDYRAYGKRVEHEEMLDNWRKGIGRNKIYHLALDGAIDMESDSNTEHDRVSDYRNASIEGKVVAKEDREVHFRVFSIVEAHLKELGVSLIKEVIVPLFNAVLVQTKGEVRKPRLTRDFVSDQKAAIEVVNKYEHCLADIKIEPDGTALTDEVILFLEQKTLRDLIGLIYKDKFL
ncbi:hypothetical protein [Paenibacillus piri]|uniref:Uncharacterized protein n=1 Tax=Paenibacillus piri TaxID=2547395 RepID=A0A4R5L0J3_9BACL|nr:hypothetical protein [Paenibacillus piri]TDG00871.1 hypothetical protein E1757_04475 [Paenibacillus piri]